MFRRLYWIVEQVGTDGSSRVTGVYTSIQDLVHRGFQWSSHIPNATMRLMLVKPDTFDSPLGAWSGPKFEGLGDDLKAFVESHEITEEELTLLSGELLAFAS